MAEIPDVRYARSGDIDIAYAVMGDGPQDIVWVSGFISHLDMVWDVSAAATTLRELATLGRLIMFDKRGTGLSDRSLGFGSIAERTDDIRAVMDAVGSDRATLYANSEGGPLAILFAATHPERVTSLILYGTFARAHWAPDYTVGVDPAVTRRFVESLQSRWGTGRALRYFIEDDPPEDLVARMARYERASCTPQMAAEIMTRNTEIDVRDILPAITVPTLVVHRTGDPVAPVAWGRWLADHIQGARFVELEGDFHVPTDASTATLPAQVREFLGADVREPDVDRVLATVLFTDIVSSTERDAKLGDRRWRTLLDEHDRIAAAHVDRFQGRLVKTTGDGLLATFDGPARGIGCAQSIRGGMGGLGLSIRAGLHTGEIERRGEDVSGLGVVIARRVCDLAGDGELLASRTVKDLVTGSGIGFADRGTHSLKGVPDDWQLYSVDG